MDTTLFRFCWRSQSVPNCTEKARKRTATCRADALAFGMLQQIGQQGISGPLIESQTQSVFARFMAVHTGGALARAVDVIPGLAILDILQVAITMDYRYPGRAGVLLSRENDGFLRQRPSQHTTFGFQ